VTIRNLALLSAVCLFSACKTSGDVRQGGVSLPTADDPSGAKTLDGDAPSAPPSAEALQRQLAVLQGELEEVRVQARLSDEKTRARISELESENAKLKDELSKKGTVPSVPPALAGGKGASSLWELAISDLRANKLDEALVNFEEIGRSYPKDSKNFLALVGAGFIHHKQKRFKEAAVVFNQAIDKHPKHAQLSLAWFGGGASLAQLGQLEDSKLFFQEVTKRFPKSAEAREAKAILAKKKKVPADLFATFPTWAGR
jgi:TolA-binding protein